MKKKILSMVMVMVLLVSSYTVNASESYQTKAIEGRWSFNVMSKWNEAIEGVGHKDIESTDYITGQVFSELVKATVGIDIMLQEPDAYVTREVAIESIGASIYNNIEAITKTSFSDDMDISEDAKAIVEAAYSDGIINGYLDGSFNPDGFVTLEQMIAIIDRVSMKDLVYTKGTLQTTMYGQVEGQLSNESTAIEWLGVPYAAAPVGSLRWKAPQEPDAWSGVLEAKTYREKGMQISGEEVIGSEDCLYLNIYRPNTQETDLPVLVFVHGGNNQSGTSQDFKGETLAVSANCIVVSIDYRLAALGWINLPALKTGDPLTDSGNFGLLDIHESLNWVNENIKAFGGDPYNVTLSGQSAGGRDVMAALISPIFKGDFQKAFAISGGMTVTEPSVGQAIDAKAFAPLVIEDGVKETEEDAIEWLNTDGQDVEDYLRGLSGERIAALMGNAAIRMEVFPHLFADGNVIPAEGFDVFDAGEYNKVPTMLGSCDQEFAVFSGTDPMFVGALFSGTLGTDEVLYPQYSFATKYGSMLYSGFNADRSAQIMSEVKGQPDIFAYRFKWGNDTEVIGAGLGALLGAFHGIDMDFLTGQYNSFISSNYTEDNLSGRNDLVNAIHGYLKNFMYFGDPNGQELPKWTPWSNQEGAGKLLVLDADKEVAKISMTTEYVIESEVFKAIEADDTLPSDQKDMMIYQIMYGRFFSESLDSYFEK